MCWSDLGGWGVVWYVLEAGEGRNRLRGTRKGRGVSVTACLHCYCSARWLDKMGHCLAYPPTPPPPRLLDSYFHFKRRHQSTSRPRLFTGTCQHSSSAEEIPHGVLWQSLIVSKEQNTFEALSKITGLLNRNYWCQCTYEWQTQGRALVECLSEVWSNGKQTKHTFDVPVGIDLTSLWNLRSLKLVIHKLLFIWAVELRFILDLSNLSFQYSLFYFSDTKSAINPGRGLIWRCTKTGISGIWTKHQSNSG